MEPSILQIELMKASYLCAASLGLWTCLSIAKSKQGDRSARTTLVAFVTLLLIPPINAYLNVGFSIQLGLLAAVSQSMTWVYGPLLLILVNQILKHKRPDYWSLLHLVPMMLHILIRIIQVPWISFQLTLSLLIIQCLAYILYCAYTCWKQKTVISRIHRDYKGGANYWLLTLMCGLFAACLYDLHFLYILFRDGVLNIFQVSMVACGFSIYVSIISLLSIFQPNIFPKLEEEAANKRASLSGLNGSETSRTDSDPLISLTDPPPSPQETELGRKLELTPTAAKELAFQLSKLTEREKTYLDPDISLSKLSDMLGISSHLLSELLNTHIHLSFYEYMNDLRFKEAIAMLQDEKNQRSITDIAFSAGFNNRNSFYKVFKEKTGTTPSDFRKKQHPVTA